MIGVPPAAALGEAHAAADAVEQAVEGAVPGTDVVVHVEPRAEVAELRERAYAAALRVPGVREVHNVAVLKADERTQVSLHLKLPGSLLLAEAHAVASDVEAAIRTELPGVEVQTHLEPLGEERAGRAVSDASDEEYEAVRDAVLELLGRPPRDVRLYRTDAGLLAFLTLALEPNRALADAHARASEIEERIRRDHPGIADVIVHTEP